jgi:hypothetical protein
MPYAHSPNRYDLLSDRALHQRRKAAVELIVACRRHFRYLRR